MKIGQIRGIELKLSNLLPLLFFIYILLGIWEKAFIVFAIILVHEIGHVVVALCWGIQVKTIELFPFGGVARIDNVHMISLTKEITLSLAGPMVNFFLAGVFFLALYHNLAHRELWSFILRVTIVIGCFNLIPVWPFDGGRIFRAILSRFTGFFFAARLVSLLGQICAGGFFIYGSWAMGQSLTNIHWWLIAGYLFYINRQERKIAFLSYMRYLTHKEKEIEAEGFLPAVLLVALSVVSLRKIIERLVPHRYHVICVLDIKGNFLGLVTEKTVISMALRGSMHLTLAEVLHEEKK
ncbi:MAG: M50 family metallopeptidase [Dehalobacterium sp.]